MQSKQKIIGRYAPSPTGELHLGNVRTALVAWLHSRMQGGKFLLRMEDLDTPRVVDGSADQILRDLEWLGLDWDDDVSYQSSRTHLYQDALNLLSQEGLCYPCFCSRKDIQNAASAPHGKSGVYTGACDGLSNIQIGERTAQKAPATRVRVDQDLQSDVGDFVIKRADGLFAYQLAVVVDDLEQGVTHVVRGADLTSSTSRQLYLASCLQLNTQPIKYLHAPLMVDSSGMRMSKRDGSESISQWRDQGRSAESLIGYLAHSLNWKHSKSPISLNELASELTMGSMLKVLLRDT